MYSDGTDEAPIPYGFVASQATGENVIKTGLVIYEGDEAVTDENADVAKKTRNQFVWVPVPDISEFVRKEWGKGISISETTSYDMNSSAEAEEYKALKSSVEKYGGFYIARYEAGNESGKIISKKNIWSFSSTRSRTTAISRAATYVTESVVGHLPYGEEWDAVLSFISKTDPNYVTSTNEGIYVSCSTIEYSGSYERTMKNNIYDMAGNVLELTMEIDADGKPICRGDGAHDCDYDNASACYPVSGRMYNNQIVEWDEDYSFYKHYSGFRVALYIK